MREIRQEKSSMFEYTVFTKRGGGSKQKVVSEISAAAKKTNPDLFITDSHQLPLPLDLKTSTRNFHSNPLGFLDISKQIREQGH